MNNRAIRFLRVFSIQHPPCCPRTIPTQPRKFLKEISCYQSSFARQQRSASTIAAAPDAAGPTRAPSPRHPTSRADFLERVADRPLPTLDELSTTRRWVRTLPIFFLIITGSALGIFNYQKVNSPIIAATLYSLRTNPAVRRELGDEVYFASRWAWIYGTINLVQGKVDVSFYVKGTKAKGLCRFRAIRVGGKGGEFKTQEWSLKMDDSGEVIQLLGGQGRDPMATAPT